MRIGVPKEIRNHEYRVGLVPTGVRELVGEGHEVYVQAAAGAGIGVDATTYQAAGAKIIPTA
jgi:alanine dehydrogenase